MIAGKVVGSVVATRKNDKLVGNKFMIVELVGSMSGEAKQLIAIDNIGAGIGEYVLVAQGSAARVGCDMKDAPVDAAIVTTHMMLAAHNIGVGSCWVMHFNPLVMQEAFNIPQNYKPVALLVMGYPAEESEPIELHSKFRPMDEVVFYDTF